MKEKNKGGRPRKWSDPKTMDKAIEQYFENCKGKPLIQKNEYVFDKYGQIVFIDKHPPTVAGLAHHLGFESTQSLKDYEKDERFSVIIKRARLRIEQYLEERLMDRDGVRGAMFNLGCNFNWREEKQEKQTESEGLGIVLMPSVLMEEPEQEEQAKNEEGRNCPDQEEKYVQNI